MKEAQTEAVHVDTIMNLKGKIRGHGRETLLKDDIEKSISIQNTTKVIVTLQKEMTLKMVKKAVTNKLDYLFI